MASKMKCRQCRKRIVESPMYWHFVRSTNEVQEWSFCDTCWTKPIPYVYPTKEEAEMEQITYALSQS